MNVKELADKIGLDEEDYRELAELFMETSAAEYDQLKHAYAAKDAEQVSRSAHSISGASGNMGLINIHEVARRIEQTANKNQLDQINSDVETLHELLNDVAQLIET